MLSPVNKFSHNGANQPVFITQLLDLSADAAAVDLEDYLVGGYLYSVEILSSADDAVTFSINSGIGTQLFTTTTAAATDGEISSPNTYWAITSTPNYTLSGLGAGTVQIEIVVVKL